MMKTYRIGDETWMFIVELESEFDTKLCYTAVRSFYVATIRKILTFSDSLIKDLGIINSELVSFYTVSDVVKLSKRFHKLVYQMYTS